MFEFLIIDFCNSMDGNEIFRFEIPNKELTNEFIKEITPIINKYHKLIEESKLQTLSKELVKQYGTTI